MFKAFLLHLLNSKSKLPFSIPCYTPVFGKLTNAGVGGGGGEKGGLSACFTWYLAQRERAPTPTSGSTLPRAKRGSRNVPRHARGGEA